MLMLMMKVLLLMMAMVVVAVLVMMLDIELAGDGYGAMHAPFHSHGVLALTGLPVGKFCCSRALQTSAPRTRCAPPVAGSVSSRQELLSKQGLPPTASCLHAAAPGRPWRRPPARH